MAGKRPSFSTAAAATVLTTKRRRRRRTTTTAATTTRRPSPLRLTSEELSSLLSLASSALSLSRRFLSDNDLLLLPSQSLSLSTLLSSSLSSPLLPPLPPPSPRPSWFLRLLSSTSDDLWLASFRLSRPSFHLLLQTLAPSLLSSPLPLPPDHKLAAALFRLAHAAPFHLVAARFGLPSPSLACRAFYEALHALGARLAHLFELPSDLPRVLQGFHWLSLPNCCGALTFARFPLKTRSLTAQGLVDSEGRFLDLSVGWHGAMHPSQILPQSKLFTTQSTVLAPGPPVQLNGGSVNRYLLGGPSCPLLPWLLTPFPPDITSDKAAVFNAVHKRGMELADKAFGRVRARWQLLRTVWTEECAEALPYVITASCLLHNFLIKCSEPMPDEGEVGERDAGFPDYRGFVDEDGVWARDVLASHLSTVSHK